MSGISDLPAMSAGMTASLAAFQAASAMMAQSVALVAVASMGTEGRAPLSYSRLLDKLA